MDHRDRLFEFLRTFDARGLPPATGDHLELDSVMLLQMVSFLEETFHARLSDESLEPDDLRSISGVIALMERLSSGEPA